MNDDDQRIRFLYRQVTFGGAPTVLIPLLPCREASALRRRCPRASLSLPQPLLSVLSLPLLAPAPPHTHSPMHTPPPPRPPPPLQITRTFRNVGPDKIDEMFKGGPSTGTMINFLDNPDSEAIFFREKAGGLVEVSDSAMMSTFRYPVLYFVKLNGGRLSDKIGQEVIYGDMPSDPLEHLSDLANGIYQPIVSSRNTALAWSAAVAKDVRDNLESFLANLQITQGHVRGITCLPLPSSTEADGGVALVSAISSESKDGAAVDLQGQIVHALETAIIVWTKQIKNVLKQDPEAVFVTQADPGPTAEVEFWKSKAQNLNGIFEQLQSIKVRRILKVLEKSKSTYNGPFAKLCKEVFHARAEANNIVKYLRPLTSYFIELEHEGDFVQLGTHFKPIIHLILLVWKSSAYYNTPARLVILMREICNTLIRHASAYLDGSALFDLIDQEDGVKQAVKMLQTTLRVIGKFKAIYFEYKARSVTECPENPWKAQNNAIFVRLDQFLERCHDILDLAQIIMLFTKLAKIEVGGTKGKILTTSVAQIYTDFLQAIEGIRSVGSKILDLDNKEFETAFYEFRNRMKELDRRLGSVLVQGFDDATSVGGRFRLLDTFDNLVNRPVIADELEKKHASLVESVKRDVEEVQEIFFVHRDAPPVASNLPPIAGALTWCRGLLERVQGPLEKMKTMDKKLLERHDTREVIKIYTSLVGQLADFDREMIGSWGHSIEAASQAKLKNPLLRRIEAVGPHGSESGLHTPLGSEHTLVPPLLAVNFDPLLVKLLREVKYFVLLGLQVPPSAMEVYQRAEIFRRHTGNLDLIVNMYNDVQTSLLPVERPLIKNLLEKIDKTLAFGVGEGKHKAKALNWKSNGIDVFIAETMTEMTDLSAMLQMLKGNLKHIEDTVNKWAAAPMFERVSKPMLLPDFLALQRKTRDSKVAVVKEAGAEIHKLMKETSKKLKISQGLPDWKSYVEFVNNVVVDGLIQAVAASIRQLANNLDPVYLEQTGYPPLLEIQCDLQSNRTVFVPEVGLFENPSGALREEDTARGIKNIIASKINDMLSIGSAFKRLDTSDGSYAQELVEASDVLVQRAHVTKLMDATERRANQLRDFFRKFEYLWMSDMQAHFKEFLEQAVTVTWVAYASSSIAGAVAVNPSVNGDDDADVHGNSPRSIISPRSNASHASAGPGYDAPKWAKTAINLDMFSDKMKTFLDIQTEITEFKTIHEVDFLKVNTQPIKQAITTWAMKWLYMHSKYLQNYVAQQLTDLHDFLKVVNKGLDVNVEAGDRDSMMEVMKSIRDVRKRTPQISSLFEPLRDIVALLKNKGVVIEIPNVGSYAALDYLDQAKVFWEGTVNKTYRVKEILQPLMNGMLTHIIKEIKTYNTNVSKFVKDFKKAGPFSLELEQREAYGAIDGYQREVSKFHEGAKTLNELEDLFELPLSSNRSIDEVHDNLCSLKGVWDVVCLVDSLFSSWKTTFWVDLKCDSLISEVRLIQNQLKKHAKKPREWPVFKMLELNVKNMATVLPLLHELRSPAMRERHWKSLQVTTCATFDRGPTFCLDDLLALNLHRHVEAVTDIVEVANKELKIESKLTSIQEIWKGLYLRFDRHRDTEVYVVSPPLEVLETLEEHYLHLQAMSGMGKFVDFFRDQVVKWQTTLGEVETVLKLTLLVQRQWASLESIFLGSADIRSQLPDDTKRFEIMDTEFKAVMKELQALPGVVQCCTAEGREGVLRGMTRELEKCERALNEYLEVKKTIFPRFYFVSNAALLDILSNGNNPPVIMLHIGSVFDGIGDMELTLSAHQRQAMKDDPDGHPGPPEAARSMVSKDKEVVPFPAPFECRGAVENWLNELVKYMQLTLRNVLATSMNDAASWDVVKTREEWVSSVPAQIALLTSQIMWTEEVEDALEELEGGQDDSLKKYSDVCVTRLEGLIRLVQGELSKGDRVKVITVITIDVHNRDVVTDLIKKKVESNVDFKWQSQLRYYFVPAENTVNIRICDFATVYSYEYTGNCGRLVITPLTDRCYVTLTTALRLMLGGAPAGPAGTGKTETTKDLARGLGLPCYVFNCSDQMNYQTMGDIFKGLTQSGAWGCFDEFNRIEIEVLSVVASQVKSILDAIGFLSTPSNRPREYQALPAGTPATKVGSFIFFGDEISLLPTCGFFITMNPGYAGRTELPENLKALFRSCAMIQPDTIPIAENMLMAEGFVKARPLSVKFITLYRLSSELLSKQAHYDWGLRAIKSVLRVAGVLKRADPELPEEAVLMRALRDFNTPKIPAQDIPIFMRLIADLFPGMELAPKGNAELHRVCAEVCKAMNQQPEEMFIQKVMQFQELLDVRHSVMLLGPAGCGKTAVMKTLAGCHNFEKPKPVTVYETINPKSVDTDELYGYMTLSKDWKDGVLSIVMRDMSKNNSPFTAQQSNKWVVLDGDIDAGWIESMNTVMDDNKVLTLVSNERIPLSDAMRMVFEISSLHNATPATVSRAGILYINETDIGYQPYVDSWLSNRATDAERHHLPDLFERYLPKIVEFFNTVKPTTITPLSMINMVQSFVSILEGLIKLTSVDKSRLVCERLICTAAMWGFGGCLRTDQNEFPKQFSAFIRGLMRAVKFPDQGDVLEFYLDPTSGEAVPWSQKVAAFSSSAPDYSTSTIVVPTVHTVRMNYLLKALVTNNKPVMFVGPAGTGKTVLVTDYLSSLAVEDPNYRYAMINMNYFTDSAVLQRQLEDFIDKRSGKTYGPPSGHLVYFVDDLNLPCGDTYGTQTPISLMRQHMDSGGWFDRTDMSLKKNIINTQYICCMNPKSGTFHVSTRLQRLFVTFGANLPSDGDLNTIFGTILSSHLFSFDSDINNMSKTLTDMTIAVHKEISAKFLPSAIKFYYLFTMRDLASVFKGLLFCRPTEYKQPKMMLRLWYHEMMRVYSDRLINDIEVGRCRELVITVAKRFIEDEKFDECYNDPCIFSHFGKDGSPMSPYMPNEDAAKMRSVVEKKLVEYNEGHAVMDLVLFEKAVQHVARIARILMVPGGHALLIGVGGSGKQSLSKLAASICQYDTVQISVSSDYSVNDLKENLRDMFRKAAVRPAEPLVFLLADTQITDERFLVFINDLLSTGRIPDLFTKEDFDGIFSALRSIAKVEGVPDNRDSMMDFFTNRVRANLHVILCFSPVGESFRQRARKFPGLINCTTADWFHEWPKDALVSVAQYFLEDVDMGGSDVRDSIAYHIAEVHLSVGEASLDYLREEKRYNYTTPKSFLELVSFYKRLLSSKRKEVEHGIKRLETGLDTLMRTNKDVESLQEFLTEKKKDVEAKRVATEALLEEMGRQRAEAETQQGLADIEKTKADRMAAQSRKLEEQAAGDLASAKPALDAANDAVNCLDKASMTELKSFVKPPAGVDKVTTALLIMITNEKKNFSWDNAKKMMAKLDSFLEKLQSYRGEDIPQDVINRVMPMCEDPEFNYERMKTKSGAAANLCNWVVNILRFNNIYKRVKPLMDSLDVATKAKRKAEEDLAVVAEKLEVIESKLAKLQTQFMAATQEKTRVEGEYKECMERLSLANRLTNGLASEKDRWGETVEVLKIKNTTTTGEAMLAASFASYIGAFGATFRERLWKRVWLPDLKDRNVPIAPDVDPLWVLASESLAATWQTEGLPSDRISLENGAVITNCSRWPLLIDPQMQGERWLKKHEELRCKAIGKKLHVLYSGEEEAMMKISFAMQGGDSVIFENVGEVLDASLGPILSKAIYRRGKSSFIKFAGEDVEYDDNFRFFLQTKLSNPHYRPEIAAQCTIINFIVTKKGLEDQLLSTIVGAEEPVLEETRTKLVLSFNTYKIQLQQLEDQLLERLANAPADILSDYKLIEGLEQTKDTATEIKEAVIRATQTGVGINQAREVYRIVATEASLFYFVMLQLNGIEHMYQYSLDSFTLFFQKALATATASSDKAQRVKELQTALRLTLFKWVVRGLFEKHRLTFLTLLMISLMQHNVVAEDCGFTMEGLRFLLLGPKTGDERSPISWMSDATWNGIKNLSNLEGFGKIAIDVEENAARFLEWYQSFAPESEKLPGDSREMEKFPFRKLLVVRIMRPDRVTTAITNFIRDMLPNGKQFVECDSELSSYQVLAQSFEDTTPLIPLYFILSPGSDVVADVDKLALKYNKVKDVSYFNISLGQGQDLVASERLEAGSGQGFWVFLNNVHLMPRWLPVLEKKMDDYAWMGAHADFRILLSSDPSTAIPVSILDRAIKITSDPPSGLKANLKQAFAAFSRDTYEELEPRTKGILFGLCQFHAVLVERKKFGSKGFNMQYPFSMGDLTSSAAVLRNYMENAPSRVPWADLRYLFGEIMYGGHIVNDFDRVLANTYMEFFMKEDLLDEAPLYPFPDAAVAATMDIFRAPSTTCTYDKILEHVEETLKVETPVAFGLHPNAELGFRTQMSESLMGTILELSITSGGGGGGGEGGEGGDATSSQTVAEGVIQDVLDTLKDNALTVVIASNEALGPFQFILMQECDYMNRLVADIRSSLIELNGGFRGDLTMSEAMEELAFALFMDRVPKRWEQKAYPSQRPLGSWLQDLQARIFQLNEWVGIPNDAPLVMWISGLFNPQSYLTAVMQVAAQAQGLELDKLSLVTEVTRRLAAEEVTGPAKDGTYIVGLSLEGASWSVAHTILEPSRPREMFCPLPVVNVRPAVVEKADAAMYICPVYKTQQRGPTYVFSLQLKTKLDKGKWTLAGVAAIMDVVK